MPAFIAPVAALLLSVYIMQTGNNLANTLVPLRGHLEDFSTPLIGAMGAAYFGGFVIGCFICPIVVRRVGHIRTFAAAAAISASALTVLPLFPNPIVWVLLRVLTGAAVATLYTVIESWLNECTDKAHRGSTFSVYQIAMFGASVTGQNLLGLADVAEPNLFSYATILLVLALVPVAMTTNRTPKPLQRVKIDIRWVIGVSPIAAFGVVFVGFANGATWSLAPVYVQSQGIEAHQVGWFMSALLIGGALSQWPIGWLSDRFDRRRMIVAVALLSSLFGALLAYSYGSDVYRLMALVFCYGLVALTIYSLGVAHINDVADPDRLVEVAGCMLLLYGVGAAIGPFLVSTIIEATSFASLFWSTSIVHLGLALFAIWRLVRKPRKRPETRPPYIVTMPRAAPVVSVMNPLSDDPESETGDPGSPSEDDRPA